MQQQIEMANFNGKLQIAIANCQRQIEEKQGSLKVR
jgi:hypothetical protein